jgi:hypothetical protein
MKSTVIVPYLLLVSFFTPPMQEFDPGKISSVNRSGYNGVAVPLVHHYETRNFEIDSFGRSLAILKAGSQKHVWPWVFFTKFIGYEEGARTASNQANKEYFRRIHGMDLSNEAGALEDFYLVWRTALKVARETGAPGIIVDPEPYTNYRAYSVDYVADRLGIPEQEVKKKLREVGAKLVDLADEIYPEAKIWYLLTGLTSLIKSSPLSLTKDYRTVTYIVLGMLERAKQKESKLEIICGGELWGYCFKNSEDLRQKIRDRKRQCAPLMSQYPNLTLAGTIAPWADSSRRRLWMVKYKRCLESEANRIEDFRPLLQELLQAYGYVWVYAADAAPYNPYGPTASIYDETMKKAVEDANLTLRALGK